MGEHCRRLLEYVRGGDRPRGESDRRAEYVEKRDAAVLPSTKAIYQAFIDAIDRIKEKLNAEGN